MRYCCVLVRHPRSKSFDWDAALRQPDPALAITQAQWESFSTGGFCVVDDILDADALRRVTAETDKACARADELLATLPDERYFIAERGAITFAPHIALESDVLLDVVLGEPLRGFVHDLVGEGARLYHDQAVYKGTEKPRRFPWHQDNGYAFVHPESYLTVWIALTDASVESGCVWAAPGMQREGTLQHTYVEPLGWEVFADPPVEPVAVPVPAGSAVMFSSLTPHLTGVNVSNSVRKAYIVQYVGPGAVRFNGPEDCDGTPLDDDVQFPAIRPRTG